MSYIYAMGMDFYKEEGDIFTRSTCLANFLKISHVALCKQIDSKKKHMGKLYFPCYFTDFNKQLKRIFFYNINKKGCLLLLNEYKNKKQEKIDFLNIISLV